MPTIPNIWESYRQPLPSQKLYDLVREYAGNRLLLSFSGRDSLACWLTLRDAGFELIPYWCYTVPHLSFDDEMLAYYEAFFGQHIIRLPHPYLYELLRSLAWQPPENARMLYWCQLPAFEYSDLEERLAQQFNLGSQYLSVVGIRAADNPMRYRLIHQMGPVGFKRRHYYYAVWDFNTDDVRRCLDWHGIKLSKAYQLFGATGDILDYNTLKVLRERAPADYRRVLDMFPCADLEFMRYEVLGEETDDGSAQV